MQCLSWVGTNPVRGLADPRRSIHQSIRRGAWAGSGQVEKTSVCPRARVNPAVRQPTLFRKGAGVSARNKVADGFIQTAKASVCVAGIRQVSWAAA